MSDIKYMEIVTWNKKMMELYNDKLTLTQKLIGRRSNGLHTEWRFTDRCGRISCSCTEADGCGCFRFKPIGYSNPYRQSRIYVPVTAEQEARLFAKACEMADVPAFAMSMHLVNEPSQEISEQFTHNGCYYGPNAIKYDSWGVRLSFITKWRLWKMHKTKMICNEACANVGLEVWPDLLNIPVLEIENYKKKLDPAELTPDEFEYLARHYFDKKGA